MHEINQNIYIFMEIIEVAEIMKLFAWLDVEFSPQSP